jgi:hypothetical protein
VNRLAPIVILLLATQAILLDQAPVAASGPPAIIEMGYGPSLLVPVTSGTPVYTVGDQLWVLSELNQTTQVSIQEPAVGNETVTTPWQSLYPGIPARLHIFSGSDTGGLWSLMINDSTVSQFAFLFTGNIFPPANLTMTGYNITSGALGMNFSASSQVPFYDAEACVLGGGNLSSAIINVPSAFGGGEVSVRMNGSSIVAHGADLANATFTFSLELYYSYSFLVPQSASTLISRDLQVASAGAASLSAHNSSGVLQLLGGTPQRLGRYELRAIFQGEAGVSVASTEVLISGGDGWTWLGGCQGSPVVKNDFQLSVHLGSAPANWPRDVYLLYRTFGVEGFANVSLGLNISAVAFVGEPWGTTLDGYSIGLQNAQGIAKYGVSNATVYLVETASPAGFSYNVGLGAHTFFQGTTGSIPPFTYTRVLLNVSKLSVTFTDNGVPTEGADIGIDNESTALTSASTGKAGFATFYLPAGTYAVTGSDKNITSSESISLAPGGSLAVTLGTGGGTDATEILIVVLTIVAAVGLVLNVYLLLKRRARRLRSTPVPSAGPQPDGSSPT